MQEYHGSHDVSDIFINFIERHPSLEKLRITDTSIREEELARLTGLVPNLVEFTLELNSQIEIIIQFLEECTNLKKLHVRWLPLGTIKGLRTHFHGEWKIDNENFGYLVERN